jgi:acyl-CoA reductase-like NAD-dependent aldehyde dehydrogenase
MAHENLFAELGLRPEAGINPAISPIDGAEIGRIGYDRGADVDAKIAEGLGEVQEMIDICDFAVGQSRQLYGLTIASERPGHRMMETWHPLGPIGVISAFNFPVAVWAWNFALAIVCGDPVI